MGDQDKKTAEGINRKNDVTAKAFGIKSSYRSPGMKDRVEGRDGSNK